MKTKPENIFVVVISILLLGYTTYRAYALSFTIDESTSYVYYATDSYRNIIHSLNLDANNHVLNSLLMKLFSTWLPLSELTLRLQSIFAHILFLVFSWLIIRDIRPAFFRMSAFIILNVNPYMLDFFSLARGYALSWGLMVAGIYFIKLYFEKEKNRNLKMSLSFIFAALSMLACFVMINYYCVLLALFFGFNYLEMRGQNKRFSWRNFLWSLLIVGTISVPALAYTSKMLIKLKTNNLFVFGGEKGFVEDTVMSVCNSVVYPFHSGQWMAIILACFGGLVFLTSFFLAFRQFVIPSGIPKQNSFFVFITMLLTAIILMIIVQHYLLGIKYVVDRAAMYLFVIFLFVTVYLGAYLAEKYRNARVLLFGLAGISIMQLIVSLNFTHVHQWEAQADVKQAMKDLGRFHGSNQKMVLLPYWYYYSTVKFYQYLFHYQWLDVDDMNRADFTQALYYFPGEAMNTFNGHSMSVLASYPETHSYLLKNNDVIKPRLLESKIEELPEVDIIPGAFSPAIEFDARKYKRLRSIRVLMKTEINFPDHTKSGQMAVSITDSSGKVIDWHARNFSSDLYEFKNNWGTADFAVYLDKIPANANKIKVFIWNNGSNVLLAREIHGEVMIFGGE